MFRPSRRLQDQDEEDTILSNFWEDAHERQRDSDDNSRDIKRQLDSVTTAIAATTTVVEEVDSTAPAPAPSGAPELAFLEWVRVGWTDP